MSDTTIPNDIRVELEARKALRRQERSRRKAAERVPAGMRSPVVGVIRFGPVRDTANDAKGA